MKQFFTAFLCIIAISLSLIAKNSDVIIASKKLFIDAPDSIFPSIDHNTRLDMIDYYECGVNRASLDIFEDSCKVSNIDSISIIIETSPILKHQLISLAPNTILLISTHSIPAKDSEISFYDYNWNKITTNKYITTPKFVDWLTKQGKLQQRDLENTIPFFIVEYSYNPENKILTLTNNLNNYFIKEDWNKISHLIHNCLQYKWTGRNFKQL